MMRTLAARVVAGVGGGPRAQGVVLRAAGSAWERLARLAAEGILRPHVAPTIGLAGVAAAQAAMETGHGRGKIVVDPVAP
jgi:NADPH:quinone reductase-like Zn-dependent oxidoreductase